MHSLAWRDIIGGGLLVAFGSWAAWKAFALDIGSANAMGPGYFPLVASSTLVVLGLLLIVPAFFKRAALEAIEWRPFLFVAASILAFGLAMDRFGLMAAIFAAIVVSAMADTRSRPLPVLALALGMCVLSYLLFIKGLGMPIRAWKGFD